MCLLGFSSFKVRERKRTLFQRGRLYSSRCTISLLTRSAVIVRSLIRLFSFEHKLRQSFSVIYSGRFKFRGVFYVESAQAYSTAS